MEDFYVKLSDNASLREVQSKLLQETAFKSGWEWYCHKQELYKEPHKSLVFRHMYNQKMISCDYCKECGEAIPYTLEQALEILQSKGKCEIEKAKEPRKILWSEIPKDVIREIYNDWTRKYNEYDRPDEVFVSCEWSNHSCALCRFVGTGNCGICPANPEWCYYGSSQSILCCKDPDIWKSNVKKFLEFLESLVPELKPKVTYKVGDVFREQGGQIAFLVKTKLNHLELCTFGYAQSKPELWFFGQSDCLTHTVIDGEATEEEFKKIGGSGEWKWLGSFKEIFGEPKIKKDC